MRVALVAQLDVEALDDRYSARVLDGGRVAFEVGSNLEIVGTEAELAAFARTMLAVTTVEPGVTDVPAGDAMTELRNLVATYDVLDNAAADGMDSAVDFGQLKTALMGRAAADRSAERMFWYAFALAAVSGGEASALMAAARAAR